MTIKERKKEGRCSALRKTKREAAAGTGHVAPWNLIDPWRLQRVTGERKESAEPAVTLQQSKKKKKSQIYGEDAFKKCTHQMGKMAEQR